MSSAAEKQNVSYTQFACIGTGFSGIGLGATIKRWYGITDVQLFDAADNVGGTWEVNTYPGCACDVPAVLYSYSWAPNAEWSTVLPPQKEIQKYLISVAHKYGLLSKIKYNATVKRCEWIETTSRWRLTIHNTKTNQVSYHECTFLYSGVGILTEPQKFDVPGTETFAGDMVHAARWRPDVSLKNKRVIVVGNGCSACQIVPAILDDTKSVTQFIRSKHWIIPPLEVSNLKVLSFLFKVVPGLLKFMRFMIFLIGENAWRGFYMTKSAAALRKKREADATAYMKKAAPAKYHDLLIPDFPIGCKRRIYDPYYLRVLKSEKIHLTDSPILEVVPEGVRTKDGITEADAIVLAIGFKTNGYLTGVEVIGRGGKTLEQHWEAAGGPGAYNATMLNGFPNFFMLLGPNTTTGHTSTIIAIENAVNYSMRVIKPIITGHALSIDVTKQAEDAYTNDIQEALKHRVWRSCNNWYERNENGVVRNASTYPYTQNYYQYRCTFPIKKDLIYKASPNPPQVSPLYKAAKVLFWTVSLVYGVKGLQFLRENDWNVQTLLITLAAKAYMAKHRVQSWWK